MGTIVPKWQVPNKMSQKDMVIGHLNLHRNITSWEAIEKYHITRISAIIFNLRREGFDIKTINHFDGNIHYGEYILESTPTEIIEERAQISSEEQQMSFRALSPK